MAMPNPVVSVIIPVFNREEFLPRALTSLQNQDFQDFEAIIVDDGSTEGSTLVGLTVAEKDPRFRVLILKNSGPATARNSALPFVRSPYITFLDSDDEYEPTHLSHRLAYIKQHPAVDIVHGGHKVIGSNLVPDRHNPSKLISTDECVLGATIFCKRKAFEALGGFRNLPYAEDADFIERAAKDYRIDKVSEPTYIYHREGTDSITHRASHLPAPSLSPLSYY